MLSGLNYGGVDSPEAGWRAHLELGFGAAQGQTFLRTNRHVGPLVVQRPFREDNGSSQVYILHPPGGVVGGDQLQLSATLEPGAQALLTAPGATKLYTSAVATSVIEQDFRVARGAHLEWLPQETIVFDGARADITTRVTLEPEARFAGWEVVCFGRPACEERFRNGHFRSRFELWREDTPLWLERNHVDPEGAVLTAAWGFAEQPVSGAFVWFPATARDLETAREALMQIADPGTELAAHPTQEKTSATLLDEVLVCRYLGPSSFRARRAFLRVWSVLRPRVLGRVALAPRIWAT